MRQILFYLVFPLFFLISGWAQEGNSLHFDGNDDRVNLGNSLSTTIDPLNTITVEAWVKPEVNSGHNGVILGNYSFPVDNGQLQVLLRRDNNGYTFHINDDNGGNKEVSAPNSVQLNIWQHIVGVWDGSTIKIYVDGILKSTTTGVIGSSFRSLTNSFVIGYSLAAGGEGFQGSIDEVRIWNIALTVDEIIRRKNCELIGNESGLLAYYKFNQGVNQANNSGVTSLVDATSNGNNGSLNNFGLTGSTSNWLSGSPVTTGIVVPTVASVTTPVNYALGATASSLTATSGGTGLLWYTTETGGTGTMTAPIPTTATVGTTSFWVSSTNANGCESTRTKIDVIVNSPATHLNFDGVDDVLSMTSVPNLPQGNTSRTIEAWIKTTQNNSGAAILTYGNLSTNNRFALYQSNGKLNFVAEFNDYNTNVSINDGNWHHIAATHDGVNLKVYLDGVQVGATQSKIFNTLGNQLNIGFRGVLGSEHFNGDIEEVRIWNLVRSNVEIQANRSCELIGNEAGLVAYYKFNQGADNSNNSGVTTATALVGTNGTLSNFALSGSTSNWKSGSPVTTGNTCVTLSNTDLEFNNRFRIFPNPARNNVNIQFSDLNNTKLEVIDSTGKVLLKQTLDANDTNINIEKLPVGMYLFKVYSNEGIATSKVIKN